MKGKKVYVLFEEKNWRGCEEYSDVVDIYENEEDAIAALKEQKEAFADEEEIASELENYEITDEERHYQCLDEGMGDNYELFVFEKIIQ